MGFRDVHFPTVLIRTPCESLDLHLYRECASAGGFAFLDLGRDPIAATRLLRQLIPLDLSNVGVRIHGSLEWVPTDLPACVTRVLLAEPAQVKIWSAETTTFAEVVSLQEARLAASHGASGLVLKGNEAAGRVGDCSAFILLQTVVGKVEVPLWLDGGIGLDTAAAARVGGAHGVVLDSQLGLFSEAQLPANTRRFLEKLDGTESRVENGFRFASRPDLPTHGCSGDTLEAIPLGSDAANHRVPMGQASAFARGLSQRFSDVREAIRGFEARMQRAESDPDVPHVLAPGNGFAQSLGIEFPIVQGPMTRVSDKTAFASALSQAGGLPFLALSMMRGEKAETLVKETAAALDGKTWGVGILGFAPPELREEQLALLHAVKPPVVLIAGGRPSQARPLQENGSTVFLHVPSASLLDLFLKEGSRHFVFEGRECGGHVGPRSSFVLWQSQLDVLSERKEVSDLHLLFAGGIHDARSAAMVAAMVAPLVARGAHVGVLMGTAYLFTHEALSSEAIGSFYQESVQKCTQTSLLETAPGHATRCVETPYVASFRSERERLETAGEDPKEIWKTLETLNLGRLRIASKSVVRGESGWVQVDRAQQEEEGMVMVGQVATLRDDLLSIRELHEKVSDGSRLFLKASEGRRSQKPKSSPPKEEPIAIIGMACIFPGAPDLETYWANMLQGHNAVAEVPKERWNPQVYFDPDGKAGETTPSKWGGFLDPIAFDPLEYGIPPRSLAAIEPVQLLSLEVANRALHHAGYGKREFDRSRTSVIFGAEAGTELTGAYGFRALYPQYMGELPEDLDRVLPTLTEDSFPGVLANVIAGRIANRLDFGGVNFTVDAACASALAALELSVKELRMGTSDTVLCGGADLHNSINDYLMFSSVHALSKKGRCAPFDGEADGIALGEGVAVVVLKRLSDAERDGDRIIALVNGVAGASDGKSLGLTAPRKDGQVRALRRAYSCAGVNPQEIEMVEAHGTGTIVGDRTELSTLEEVFHGSEAGSCVLGSVKSQIGHTKCAAGMAGLIRAALAVERGVQLSTLHIEVPNAAWKSTQSPFAFLKTPRPWMSPVRRAGVSAFGFGGTNFHAIVSSAKEDPQKGRPLWASELFSFKGNTFEHAQKNMERMLVWLRAGGDAPLRNLAFEALKSGDGPIQHAFVAQDTVSLSAHLLERLSGDASSVRRAESGGQLAFLMSGQGSQRPRMLEDLFLSFPFLRSILRAGEAWMPTLFPPQAFGPKERAAEQKAITDTRMAQPTLGMADMALYRLYGAVGIVPDMAGGHSYGEWAALCAAGVLPLDALLEVSKVRAESILASAGEDPGTMASVKASAQEIAPLLEEMEGVVLANINAPKQTVISGTTVGIAEAEKRFKEAGFAVRRFSVACAFHSPVLAGADRRFAEALAPFEFATPDFPVWSNTTAEIHGETTAEIKETMATHLIAPVRFVEQIEGMYAAGARTFVECGPGRIQTTLVTQILGDRPHRVIASEIPGESALTTWQNALVSVWKSGRTLDPSSLFTGRECERVDLDDLERLKPSPSLWWVNGQTAWPNQGELPDTAMRPIPKEPIMAENRKPGGSSSSDPAAAVVLEFIGGMREAIQAQRDVVLGYLGTSAGARIEAVERSRPSAPLARPPQPTMDVSPVALEPKGQKPELSITEMLLELVSERTGYPTEMIGLDMDLEADLSIDSIKRIEILGTLGEELGWADDAELDRDKMVEDLAALKSLREIVSWLESSGRQAGGKSSTSETPAAVDDEPDGSVSIARYEMRLHDAPALERNGVALKGKSFALIPGSDALSSALIAALRGEGATVNLEKEIASGERLDGLLDLSTAANGGREVGLFRSAREVLQDGGSWVMATTSGGGAFGGNSSGVHPQGVSGMLKSISREWPEARVRSVDLDSSATAEESAHQLIDELLGADPLVEVGYRSGKRKLLCPVPVPHGGPDTLSIPEGAVVLVTGGARGITAQSILGLARRGKMTVVLCGRSPLPEEEESATAVANTRADLRQVFMHRGTESQGTPAEIEGRVNGVLRAREMRETFVGLEASGTEVDYRQVDVRDESKFAALIDDIYEKYGRLDGVIHGAGVIEDGLMIRKEESSFLRVFETKVIPAQVLQKKLRDDISFVVFFSSVSGVFGNRGQVDYAAANNTLDQIAHEMHHRLEGHVVSINWGPWRGKGMISETLEREYNRRGIHLISQEEGVDAFLRELSLGTAGPAQVVLMCATPEAMA